jgi:hypothetical protein
MAQTCTKCSRANPPEAIYCYFDGFVLAGNGRQGGPVAVGSQAFAHPFVFPSGRTCRSFNELALACQEEWASACDLLQEGHLETFFGGIGRIDLARAAKEAKAFPDRERGLDQVLAKLPADVLEAPKLRVDPVEVSLGTLQVGEERTFELHLENQGGRLLYGTVTCADGVWLALGDAGAAEKHFQFTHDLAVPVRVRGDRLQARIKPIEARLVVESNGGTITVAIRAEVPIKPFPKGVLAGAKTPRHVCEKCQASPKEAASLFEAGEVEKWYAANGWQYPVKVPAASGLAAVQQFFEALGVTKPPKVDISQREITLSGNPGEQLSASVSVSSQEKRPVYAHATSNVPWLEVGKPKFAGRTATINLKIPTVPNRPGETLQAKLMVQSNGNQRFDLPVTLQIGGANNAFNFDAPAPPQFVDEPLEVLEVVDAKRSGIQDEPPPPARRSSPDVRLGEPPPKPVERKAPPPPMESGSRRRQQRGLPAYVHALPAALLLLSLVGVLVYDILFPTTRGGAGGPGAGGDQVLGKQVLGAEFSSDNRFGLVLLENEGVGKKITSDEQGRNNNTRVKIDDREPYLFGTVTPSNKWVAPARNGRKILGPKGPKSPLGQVSTMLFGDEKVRVTQRVEIVAGQTKLLDTALVVYTIRNVGNLPRSVGLRIMIDTYIGKNDGVPFAVAGQKGFLSKPQDFGQGKGSEVPQFLEAIEDPKDPKNSVTVRMALKDITLPAANFESEKRLVDQYKGSEREVTLEGPEWVRISNYPSGQGGFNAAWDWVLTPQDRARDFTDSCVALYWETRTMRPGEVRYLAFTYGLSKLEVGELLALSDPGRVQPNRDFELTAYAWNVTKGQKVRLDLPAGLRLAPGESAEKTVSADKAYERLTWKVRATQEGKYNVGVSSGGKKASRTVEVKGSSSIFG